MKSNSVVAAYTPQDAAAGMLELYERGSEAQSRQPRNQAQIKPSYGPERIPGHLRRTCRLAEGTGSTCPIEKEYHRHADQTSFSQATNLNTQPKEEKKKNFRPVGAPRKCHCNGSTLALKLL